MGASMKILIACEFSGIVRDAFIARGHDAISCDLLPTERLGPHYQGDVRDIIDDGFDMMIAHPPCTHLCVSGARWFPAKIADGRQQSGIDFFMMLAGSDIAKIAIENPVGIMSTKYRKPNQIIQPYEFGHPETKKTCLWLKGLPGLTPTKVVEPEYIISNGRRYSPMHYQPPGKDRGKLRSITYQGIADAMAEQWG